MDPSFQTNNGEDCLQIALKRGLELKIIKFLIAHSCNAQTKIAENCTRLHYYVGECSDVLVEVLQYLIEDQKINPNAQNDKGKTLLDLAIKKGVQEEVIEYLIGQKINIDNQPDSDGTLLHYLCKHYSKLAFLKYLIEEQKIDPRIKNSDGQTCLHILCQDSKISLEILGYLIDEKKMDINSLDTQKQSCFYFVIMIGGYYKNYEHQFEVMQFFIQREINLKQTNNLGQTVWHYLCNQLYPHFEKMHLVIKNGLDMNIKNHGNKIALDLLFLANHKTFILDHIEYFMDKGLDINLLNKTNKKHLLEWLLLDKNYPLLLKVMMQFNWTDTAFLMEIKKWITPTNFRPLQYLNTLPITLIELMVTTNIEKKEQILLFIGENLSKRSLPECYPLASPLTQKSIFSGLCVLNQCKKNFIPTGVKGLIKKFMIISPNEHALNIMGAIVAEYTSETEHKSEHQMHL